MNDLPLIDMIAATVVFAAIVRGVWIGLVREGLSLAAIGLCTIVTRVGLDPLTVRLTDWTAGELTGKTAVWVAGVLLVMVTILFCGVVARVIRKGVVFAGLGWADRLGGGALGMAEGTIIAAVIVLIAVWLVGPDHPATEGAWSVEVVEEFRTAQLDGLEGFPEGLPAVASPGEWFRPAGRDAP